MPETNPKFVLRTKLSELSGVSGATIKKYSDLGLLEFIPGRHRRYETDSSLKRLMEIARLKSDGNSLSMIRNLIK